MKLTQQIKILNNKFKINKIGFPLTLEIKNLSVQILDLLDFNHIITNLNLKIKQGQIHTIMGPNGSGKSTLSKVLAGHPFYKVVNGELKFKEISLLSLVPEERAKLGLFLGFQYPLEIDGVSNQDFFLVAYNEHRKLKNLELLDPFSFYTYILKYLKLLEINPSFLNRYLNQGFSGGEKKKNEILQLILLNSNLGILDEIDSGLDIDALKVISKALLINIVNSSLLQKDFCFKKSFLLITHYQRLLTYINPDVIHIMKKGKILCTGDYRLSNYLEKKGYDWLSLETIFKYLNFIFYKIFSKEIY